MAHPFIDLAFLSLVLYLTSLWGEFLFDDITGFSVDKNIMAGNVKKLFPGHFRTLLHASYAWSVRWNRRVFGFVAHPFFLHLGNVGLHAINGSLIYIFLEGLGCSGMAAFFGAAVFIAHPLAVNAVANISGRSSVLSGTFTFAALALAAHGHWGLALCAVLPALWSKEDTVTLPLVLGSMAYLEDYPAWWVFFALPLAGSVVLWKKFQWLTKRTGAKALEDLGFPPAMESAEYHKAAFVETVLKYPQWVLGVGLNIDHDVEPVKDNNKVALACGIVTVLAMTFFAFPSLRLPILLMAVSPLIVYWFIVLPDPIAEHRAYISMAGIALAAALAWNALPTLMSIAMLVWFELRTVTRQHAWSDGIRLWSQAYRDGSTRKVRVLSNLNWAYQKTGNLQMAEHWAREALKIAPNVFPVRYNLSRIAEDCGNIPAAVEIMEESVKRTPVWQAHKRLGQLYEMTGALEKALPQYIKVLEFQSLGPDTMDNKADTLNQIGSIHFRWFVKSERKDREQLNLAMDYFVKANARDPKNTAIMYNLGMASAMLNDKAQARQWLDKMGPDAQIPSELKELCAC